MRADRLAERAGVGELRERLAHLFAAAADRIERLDVLGQLDEDAADLLVDRRREQRRGSRCSGPPGAKVGSLESEPSTACIDPVTWPSRFRRVTNRSGALSARRARAPSRRARRARTPAARPASRRAAGRRTRTSRRAGAMFVNPCSVRKRSSSSSGLTPGSRRRKTLRISSSSKTIDVLDCSLVITRAVVSSVPRLAKPSSARNSSTPSPAGSVTPARIMCTSSRTWRGSASASRSSPLVSSWYVSCVPVSKTISTISTFSSGSASCSDARSSDVRVHHLPRLRGEPARSATSDRTRSVVSRAGTRRILSVRA